MPALITHYRFGIETYESAIASIGGTRDEADGFLLGNQGPDVLFYALANPRIASAFRLARWLHRASLAVILRAFVDAAETLPIEDHGVARAYTLGFLCHYVLDSTIHPFIYAQQFSLCDAGEPGLDRSDGSEVHAAIETELDELVLTTRMDATVAEFQPAREILVASEGTLRVIDELYARALEILAPNVEPPVRLFSSAFASFRRIQGLLYSPNGRRSAVIGRLERIVRRHSYLEALSHRDCKRTESAFDNRERAPWIDPALKRPRTESFYDLYDAAFAKAVAAIERWDRLGGRRFVDESLPELTGGRNFLGDFVEPVIVDVEDGDA